MSGMSYTRMKSLSLQKYDRSRKTTNDAILMKGILQRFKRATWPKKLVFIIGCPVVLALALPMLVYAGLVFSVTAVHEIVTGCED